MEVLLISFQSADSVQLALELDGSKLEGRSIRVKRSVKKEKQKNKPGSKGATKKPTKRPTKGSGVERGPGRGGFKSPKTFAGSQRKTTKGSTSFKGEMADPSKKTKKKGLKKKLKAKTVHI